MKKTRIFILVLVALILLVPYSAFAQTYYFKMDELTVHVFWQEDGTAAIDYTFVFSNDQTASKIDYVDVGLPNGDFNRGSITADKNGQSLSDISRSGYQGFGTGVAVGLGSNSISPGQTGRVHVFVGEVRNVLYPDDEDKDYVSAVFVPTYFGAQYMYGNTDLTVTYHFPPGVQPEEPRWHTPAPDGFPSEPETGFDGQDRITYTWHNPSAFGYKEYKFGASFPANYVPESAVVRPSFFEKLLGTLGIAVDDLIGITFCCGFGGFISLMVFFSYRSTKRRKMKYLSPKIAIEGHGIKRGLTAVEAAILLEQPLDKILTMILFAAIKKNAATVIKSEPLEIELADPLPEDLRTYEVQFLEAFKKTNKSARKKALQNMVVALVKSVSSKMKGFSRRETVAYYRDIVKRAWAQVEAAQTPEVRSEKFDEMMEWTMLDKDYEDRTRDIFRGYPVFIPTWWHRYDPVYRRSAAPRPSMQSPVTPGAPQASLPHLPGSDFAASVVNGVQNFSSGVIGNLTDFTSGITQKTNPVPVSTSSRSSSSRSGGGCACACACACAGCACACAGGGR
jgi:hypothetical protein